MNTVHVRNHLAKKDKTVLAVQATVLHESVYGELQTDDTISQVTPSKGARSEIEAMAPDQVTTGGLCIVANC